jgi:hypothetical protein
VLLDERLVLTCAHVVENENNEVTVHGAADHTEWSSTAHVADDSWLYRNDGTHRGDVTLLELDDPAPGHVRTRLWCAPLSGGEVHTYGYPATAPDGIWVDARLGGDGGRGHELGQLNPVSPGLQWIEPGFSGAGVVVTNGSHAGHVIGIVVLDYRNEDAKHAWLMPAETIRHYLPGFARHVAGESGDRIRPDDHGLPELPRGDVLRLALTQELSRLLTGGWTGAAIIPRGGGTGNEWLVRLVRTADPVTRASTPNAELTGAPQDTILGLGSVDAAYDARGKTVAELTRYLAERFGLPDHGLVRELLRRQPPPCIVIDGVDRAHSPNELIREVVRPLAAGARTRGMRLVLGFDGEPPDTLPYQVSLDPAPLARHGPRGARHGPRGASSTDAPARVAKLAAAEEDAARLSIANRGRFRRPPPLPLARAPLARIRLAVASAAGADPELTAIDAVATEALGEAESFIQELRQADEELTDLRHRLEADRERADRHFRERPDSAHGDEDDPLAIRYDQVGALYEQAREALWTAPVDLASARELVKRYEAEIDRFIAEIGEDGGAQV